jgi:hypothetical protein
MQHLRKNPGLTGAMRLSFASEAVEVHFTRCAALQEYLLLATIYSQPRREFRQWYVFLAPLLGAVFLTAYGFWTYAPWSHSAPPPESPRPIVPRVQHPPESPPRTVQRVQLPDVGRPPTGLPLNAPSHTSSGAASQDIPAENALAPHITRPSTPQAVPLSDLLARKELPERTDHVARAHAPQLPPGATASDVHVGDLLRLEGWVHRVSRDPDHTYRLQVSPSRKAGGPSLVAVMPYPDQASKSPAVRAQLQTVRSFVTQRLLRKQEPSPRGSVMRRPIFVHLTGQLASPDPPLRQPPQGKGRQDTTRRWELRPVLEVQFASPPGPSDRSDQD